MIIKLLENIGINEYTIKLINKKLLFYGSIFTFNLIELETLKVYINIQLKTRTIQLSKFSCDNLIFNNKKPNNNFYLCINY